MSSSPRTMYFVMDRTSEHPGSSRVHEIPLVTRQGRDFWTAFLWLCLTASVGLFVMALGL
jgi:hypothetical protein